VRRLHGAGAKLIDKDGTAASMAVLLPVSTSFASPRLQLGYRELTLREATPARRPGLRWRGLEFH
jgi:cobyrinic acid a,c-diamide synthase